MKIKLNRRHFLSQFGALGGALAFSPFTKEFQDRVSLESGKSSPTIVATWGNEAPVRVAWEAMAQGKGYALDGVEAGSRYSEADPENQYVGRGGHPDREGRITLDASIMNEKGGGGCVAFLENILHPISVARKIMEVTPHVMLVGEGAYQFALAQGFTKEDLMTEKTAQEYQQWLIKSEYKPVINAERHDTIGLLGLDSLGRLAGACTTSGMPYKMRGRVGDSPVLGAGLYVDGAVGAATTSGLGELVLRTLGSFMVVEEMRRGASPTKACAIAVKRIAAKLGQDAKVNQVGFVAIDKNGRSGSYALQPGFNYTVITGSGLQILETESLF